MREIIDSVLGRLPFPAPMLLLFGSIFAALALGNRLAKGERATVERSIWLLIGLTLLAARAGFVFRYRDFYLGDPLRILDIRDGGFRPAVGIAAGIVAGIWSVWRQANQRTPVLAALAVGCAVWGVGSAVLAMSRQGQAVPDAALATLDGGSVRLRSMLGKPMVVNLWATWCPPCRREMPVLARAQAEHPGVTFVFVNQGEQGEAVKTYLAAQQLAVHNVLLDGTTVLARATGSGGLPTTLFFDARGKLVDRRLGELSPATLAQGLESLREP